MGAPDLELAIDNMQYDSKWVNHVLGQADIKGANAMNKRIANRNFCKLFLARWIVLYAFLEAAKKPNKGDLPKTIRRDWLFFQIGPSQIGPVTSTPAPTPTPGIQSIPSHILYGSSPVPAPACCPP